MALLQPLLRLPPPSPPLILVPPPVLPPPLLLLPLRPMRPLLLLVLLPRRTFSTVSASTNAAKHTPAPPSGVTWAVGDREP